MPVVDENLTVEEKIADSATELYRSFVYKSDFTMQTAISFTIAAIPEITKHYLKGQ